MASRSLARSAPTMPRRSSGIGANLELCFLSSHKVSATGVRSVTPPSDSYRSRMQSCLSCTTVRHFSASMSPIKKPIKQQRSLCNLLTHGRAVVRQKSSAHNLRRCTGRRDQVKCQLHPELEKLANITVPGVKGSANVAAFAARPAKARPGKLPVVIMIHEFYGLTEDMVGKAQALAEELGALVIAPDTYRGDWTKFIPKAIFLALSTPQERVNDDLDSVVAWASQQSDADITRLAVMGFCYGGGKAIRYSATRGNAAATVVFYGSPLTDVDVLARLKGPVLLIYGDKDAQFPPAKVHAFRDALVKAGVNVKQSMYPGQGHAFFRNMAQVEAGSGPQRQAWSELLAFLRETLF